MIHGCRVTKSVRYVVVLPVGILWLVGGTSAAVVTSGNE